MFCNIPGMSQPKDAPALATEIDKLAAKLTEMGIQFEDRQIYLTRGRQISVYEKGRKVWDAICGPFSYGGQCGLLEVTGAIVDGEHDNGDVKGWQTADQVIEMVVTYQNKKARKNHG